MTTDQERAPKLVQPQDPSARRVYWLNHIRAKRENGEVADLRPTPEQMAVAIAKCSRSTTPFDQNVDDVSLEKAAEFHEKWVVGYGHASVAEHAVASLALQNVPQVIVKILEDSRLASFTEKSSRYQVFTRDRVGVPKTLAQHPLMENVNGLFDALYGLYDECYPLFEALFRERNPKAADMSEGAYNATLKAMICDRTRYLLPAASLTSLGMTANARVWERAIVKLLSSPDALAQQIGEEVKGVLKGFAHLDRDQALKHFPFPTLLKYADFNEYQSALHDDIQNCVTDLGLDQQDLRDHATADRPVTCTFDDRTAELRIAAALLAKHARLPMGVAMDALAADTAKRDAVLKAAIQSRGAHDAPPREFEHAWFQHEIVMDYGAWRDIQRHRICTPSNQTLGTDLGYDMPEEFMEIGKDKEFMEVMDTARDLYHAVLSAGLECEAEYLVPMAYRRRMVVSWNLRELFHFIELRSGKKGHPSYRRIAQDIWRTLNEAHPLLASFIRVDLSSTSVGTLGEKPKGF